MGLRTRPVSGDSAAGHVLTARGPEQGQPARALGRAVKALVMSLVLAQALAATPLGTSAWAQSGRQAAAAGSDKVYIIANYPVYAAAKNAVAAKRQAMKEGQQAAFRALLKRILPVTDYARIKPLTQGEAAARFIDGIAVRSEQNSATEYIAALDIAFQPQAVRSELRANGIPFIDTQAAQTVVVPVLLPSDGSGPPQTDADWSRVWKDLDLKNSVTPIRISPPTGALSARQAGELSEGQPEAIRQFASGFASSQTIAALARLDETTGKLEVILAGRDAAGPFTLKRAYPVTDGDVVYAKEYAAVVSQGIIEGRWKAIQVRRGFPGGTGMGDAQRVLVEVYFRSPAQWYEIEGELRSLPGLEGFATQSVSARSATLSLQYPGGGGALASAVTPRGFEFTPSGDRWLLRKSGP